MEKEAEKLKKEIEECEKQKQEYLAGWKRERADFLNYKKDEVERLGRVIDISKEEIISELLPILDNICLAEEKLPKDLKNDCWVEGMLKIKAQINDFFKKEGVKDIESLGKSFDPHTQEAMERIEGKGSESGIVAEVIQKGYTLNGRVIRPAKVKIFK